MKNRLKNLLVILILAFISINIYAKSSSGRSISFKSTSKSYSTRSYSGSSYHNSIREKTYVSNTSGKSYSYQKPPQSYFAPKNNTLNITNTSTTSNNHFFTGAFTYWLLFGGKNSHAQGNGGEINNITQENNVDNTNSTTEDVNVANNNIFNFPDTFNPYKYQIQDYNNFNIVETYGKVSYLAGNGKLVAYSNQNGIYFIKNKSCNINNEKIGLSPDEQVNIFSFDDKNSILAITNKNNAYKIKNICQNPNSTKESDFSSDDITEVTNIIKQATTRIYLKNTAVILNSDNNSLLYKDIKLQKISFNFPVTKKYCKPVSTDINNNKIDHIEYNCPSDNFTILSIANNDKNIYVNTGDNIYQFSIISNKYTNFESYLPNYSVLFPEKYNENLKQIEQAKNSPKVNQVLINSPSPNGISEFDNTSDNIISIILKYWNLLGIGFFIGIIFWSLGRNHWLFL